MQDNNFNENINKELKQLEELKNAYNDKYQFPIKVEELEINYKLEINYNHEIPLDEIHVSERPHKELYDFLENTVFTGGLMAAGIIFFPLGNLFGFATIAGHFFIQYKKTEKKYNFYDKYFFDCNKFERYFFNEIIEKIKENLNLLDYKNKICSLSKSFVFEEKFENNIKDILNLYSFYPNLQKFKNYYNVLVLGRTSVGKRTLINSILELNSKDEAKVGFGRPITMGIF